MHLFFSKFLRYSSSSIKVKQTRTSPNPEGATNLFTYQLTMPLQRKPDATLSPEEVIGIRDFLNPPTNINRHTCSWNCAHEDPPPGPIAQRQTISARGAVRTGL
jgi:hypothetical protein